MPHMRGVFFRMLGLIGSLIWRMEQGIPAWILNFLTAMSKYLGGLVGQEMHISQNTLKFRSLIYWENCFKKDGKLQINFYAENDFQKNTFMGHLLVFLCPICEAKISRNHECMAFFLKTWDWYSASLVFLSYAWEWTLRKVNSVVSFYFSFWIIQSYTKVEAL